LERALGTSSAGGVGFRCAQPNLQNYYNARYYDPFAGQFTQPDSLVADPLDPAAWNRFSYVHDSPTNYVDPRGHVAIAVPLLLIAGGILAGELLYVDHLQRTGQQANLNDLLTYMAWGGVAGAFCAAVAFGGVPVVGGATFGNLFMAGLTTGAAKVIVTGLEQGSLEPKEAGNAFLSGFYSSYGLSLVTNAIAAVPLFRLSRSMVGKALVYGALGSGYEAVTKGERKLPNVLDNFLIYSLSGLTSPAVGKASTKIAMHLFGVAPPSSGLYPAVPFLVDRLATGLGYGLSATTQTAVKSSMIEMYRQETKKAWEWFLAH
jgi:RHS repeat-associated protein